MRAGLSGLVVIAGAVLFALGIVGWSGDDPDPFEPFGDLAGAVDVPGDRDVALEAGVEYQVYVMGPDLVRPSSAGPELGSELSFGEEPTVTLHDATGGAVRLREPDGLTTFDGAIDGVVMAVVDVPADGTYALAASGGDPDVAQVGIGEEVPFDVGVSSNDSWLVIGGTVLFVAGFVGLVFSAGASGSRRMRG